MKTTLQQTELAPLRDAKWAMKVFGYENCHRVSFWQFVQSQRVPTVRLGPRRIMFDEGDVRAFIRSRRSNQGAA